MFLDTRFLLTAMPNNKIAKIITIKELRKLFSNLRTGFDSGYILKKAHEEVKELKGMKMFDPGTNYYKAMTLFEFDRGILLASSIPDRFIVFALEFSKNLQSEYECKTQSEKSIAEITSLNFVRVLETQNRINSYLNRKSIEDIGIKYLTFLSKELDRAERHYLSSLQMLRLLKTSPLQMNIKTNTAVVGQNQIVQANTNDKSK